MHFELSPHAFPTDRAKVCFMMSYLKERARAWARAEWARNSPICSSLKDFTEALLKTFDPVSSEREKARELNGLRQGGESVSDYAVRFWTLAAESGWNEVALYDVFLKGLAGHVQERLLPLDLPSDLDSLIALAIRTDNRLREFKVSRGGCQQRSDHPQQPPAFPGFAPCLSSSALPLPPHPAGSEEPMQLGRAQLTQAERQRRLKEGRCFYCGESGHLVATCPTKAARVVRQSSTSGSTARNLTSIKVTHNTTVTELKVLIYSGADESLMDWGLARRLRVKTETVSRPIRARALNGNLLFTITHITEPIALTIDNHNELMSFYLFHSPAHTMILGHPWLIRHNPHIDWPTGRILGWGGGLWQRVFPV